MGNSDGKINIYEVDIESIEWGTSNGEAGERIVQSFISASKDVVG